MLAKGSLVCLPSLSSYAAYPICGEERGRKREGGRKSKGLRGVFHIHRAWLCVEFVKGKDILRGRA